MRVIDHIPVNIRSLAPYQPGKPIGELARERGLSEREIIKLASNENPSGMSPKARAVLDAVAREGARYPDGNGFVLKSALSHHLGVALDRIVLGNGSNDVLDMAARLVLGPGTEAVYAQYAFAVYAITTQALGAKGVVVPAKDYGHDLEAMLAAITPRTRMIFIANPNNPTGTFVPGEALEAFLNRVPLDVLVVLDEAYGEYLAPEDRYDALPWLARFPNLLLCRTFSKIYGLASLRVGYGLGHPEIIDMMNRIRQPFNVNSFGLEAAVAALEDEAFVARSAELNRQGLQQLYEGFARLGLQWVPSRGNFVMVRVGDASAVNEALLDRGVIVRPIAGYGLPEWLRVTVGLPEENARFLDALTDILGT